MVNPTPGKSYAVQPGDSLWKLSTRAYGSATKWRLIWKANETSIRSGDPNIIYPGETLYIPHDAEKIALKQAATPPQKDSKPRESFTFLLEGIEYPVRSGRVQMSIDSIVDEFTVEILWTPGADAHFDKWARRYSYARCQIYLGPKLVLTGKVYNVTNKLATDGRLKVLNGNSIAADIIDSAASDPYFIADTDMRTIATTLLEPFSVAPKFLSGKGFAIDYFEWGTEETVGAVLNRVATQSGQLVNSDEYGNLLFEIPDIKAASVGTLKEGDTYVTDWSGTFNGRSRFASYVTLGQTGDATSIWATAKDPTVPAMRRMVYVAEDLDGTGVAKNANWKRSKQISDSMSIQLPVAGWYSPTDVLWMPGQIVIVDSETLEMPKYRMLIRVVDFSFTTSGLTASLTIVPPESLTGGEVKVDW